MSHIMIKPALHMQTQGKDNTISAFALPSLILHVHVNVFNPPTKYESLEVLFSL